MTRIIGVVSGKGGVGKTTCVVNLSTILTTKFGKKVAMVDCNITSSHLGLQLGFYRPSVTLNDVLRGEARMQEAMYSYLPDLTILPASLSLNELEGVNIKKLRVYISRTFKDYDFVLLDAAAGFGKEATSAILASDELIFISTPDIPSITDVIKGKYLAEKLKVKPIGLILNRILNKKFELKTSEITHLTGLPILGIVPEDIRVMESIAIKTPVVMYHPSSRASLAYMKIAASIAGEYYREPKVSLFDRIKRFFSRTERTPDFSRKTRVNERDLKVM